MLKDFKVLFFKLNCINFISSLFLSVYLISIIWKQVISLLIKLLFLDLFYSDNHRKKTLIILIKLLSVM